MIDTRTIATNRKVRSRLLWFVRAGFGWEDVCRHCKICDPEARRLIRAMVLKGSWAGLVPKVVPPAAADVTPPVAPEVAPVVDPAPPPTTNAPLARRRIASLVEPTPADIARRVREARSYPERFRQQSRELSP